MDSDSVSCEQLSSRNPQSMLIDEARVPGPSPGSRVIGVPRPKSSRSSKSRVRAATPREIAFAANLNLGQSMQAACRNAGYPAKTARRWAHKMAKREQVIQARMELARNIKAGQLGGMAKSLLLDDLVDPPKGAKNAKARLGIVRTALEVDGMIGGPSELHLHQHTHLPESVKTMLLDEMKRIQGAEDAEIISEGATSSDQDQEDHDGVQGRSLALGLENGAAGQVEVPSDSHSA